MNRWFAAVTCSILLATTLSACGGFDTLPPTSTDDGTTTSTVGWRSVPPTAAALPPASELIAGTARSSAKPVLINFWLSECGPCTTEMPLLQRLDRTGKVSVVGVTRDNLTRVALAKISETGVTYPNYDDPDRTYSQAFYGMLPGSLVPTSVLIVGGRAVAVHLGPFHGLASATDYIDKATGQG